MPRPGQFPKLRSLTWRDLKTALPLSVTFFSSPAQGPFSSDVQLVFSLPSPSPPRTFCCRLNALHRTPPSSSTQLRSWPVNISTLPSRTLFIASTAILLDPRFLLISFTLLLPSTAQLASSAFPTSTRPCPPSTRSPTRSQPLQRFSCDQLSLPLLPSTAISPSLKAKPPAFGTRQEATCRTKAASGRGIEQVERAGRTCIAAKEVVWLAFLPS